MINSKHTYVMTAVHFMQMNTQVKTDIYMSTKLLNKRYIMTDETAAHTKRRPIIIKLHICTLIHCTKEVQKNNHARLA